MRAISASGTLASRSLAMDANAPEGKAILVISSELPELLGICDRIYALSSGRITGVVDRTTASPERFMQLMTRVKE